MFHAESETFISEDICVSDGLVVECDGSAVNEEVIDVTGLVVVPGLVDLHTHVFRGQDLGIDARQVAPAQGTTTMIDTGSAGGHLIGAFREIAVRDGSPRVAAFVNIASIGTTSIMLRGELHDLHYCDEDVAADAIEENRDFVLGIKVRASSNVAGRDAVEALERARSVADRVSLPLMCHLGPAPASSDAILGCLDKGDILTHCYTGFPDNAVTRDRKSLAKLQDAVERGVVLDVGHGASGFSFETAAAALREGVLPTTISSDLHSYSLPLVEGLPSVLSKFLALGLGLSDVFVRATSVPAQVVGMDRVGVGNLSDGSPADIAVFRIHEGVFEFADGFGGLLTGHQKLEPVLTMYQGEVVFDPERRSFGMQGGV